MVNMGVVTGSIVIIMNNSLLIIMIVLIIGCLTRAHWSPHAVLLLGHYCHVTGYRGGARGQCEGGAKGRSQEIQHNVL